MDTRFEALLSAAVRDLLPIIVNATGPKAGFPLANPRISVDKVREF
jgi:hypothetical protein